MLSKLWVENFKAFGPDQTIDLAPITIIFGPNDAGKSSILQAMQGMADTDKITSNFEELVHQKETDRSITVGFLEQHRTREGFKSLGGLKTTYGWNGSKGGKLQSDIYGQDLKLALRKKSDKIETGDSDLGLEAPWTAGCHIADTVMKKLRALEINWYRPMPEYEGDYPFQEWANGPIQLVAFMQNSGLQWTPHWMRDTEPNYAPLNETWFRIAVTGLSYAQISGVELWEWSTKHGGWDLDEPFGGDFSSYGELTAHGGYGHPTEDYVDSVLLALLEWLEEECRTALLFMKIRSDVISLSDDIQQGVEEKLAITTSRDEDEEAWSKEFNDVWFERVQQMLLDEEWNKDWKWGEYNLKRELGKMALWTYGPGGDPGSHMSEATKQDENAEWNTISGLENLRYIALQRDRARQEKYSLLNFGPCPVDEFLDVERIEYALDLTRKAISWIEKGEALSMGEVIDSILPCYDPAEKVQLRDFPRNGKTGDLWGVEERFPQIIEKINREFAPKNMWRLRNQPTDVSRWLSYLMDKDRTLTSERDEEGVAGLQSSDGVLVSLEESGRGIQAILPKLKQILDKKTVDGHSLGEYHNYFEDPEPVLWMEEPEVHLHPKSQARLADALIYGALNFDVDQPEDESDTEKVRIVPKQIIIETHSEHILTRLLRRVRETTNNTGDLAEDQGVSLPTWTDVRPEDICILYVDPEAHEMDGTASVIRRLKIGDNGELLDPFPDGFFQSELDDRLKGYPTK